MLNMRHYELIIDWDLLFLNFKTYIICINFLALKTIM